MAEARFKAATEIGALRSRVRPAEGVNNIMTAILEKEIQGDSCGLVSGGF